MSTSASTSHTQKSTARRSLAAIGIGNALEWYDWTIYAVFSPLLAQAFFPQSDGVTALLETLAVFAVGFFFRPLGGLLLSAVADQYGRRVSLAVAICLMALGSLIIGIAPTSETAGVLAPLLLVVARVMQGLSTGGEFGAGTTYLAEIAPPGKRGTYSSFYYITDTLGTMMAVATSFALRSLLAPDAIHAWGWRIPFILGAILGIVGFVVRRSIAESEVFMDSEKIAKPRVLDAIRLHPRASLQVFGITAGATAWFYTFGIYLPSYAKAQNEGGSRAIDIATLIAEAVFCIALPFFGAFSDRFGRRLSALLFYGIATVAAIPLFGLFTPNAAAVFAIQTLGLLIFAFYGSIAPTLMSEMFPTEVRAAGLGFPYAVAVALIGGTAPYVLELLSKKGSGIMFAIYLAALSFVSFVVAWSLRDRRHDDLRNI